MINGDLNSVWQKQVDRNILQREPDDQVFNIDDRVEWSAHALESGETEKLLELYFGFGESQTSDTLETRVVETVFVIFVQDDDDDSKGYGFEIYVWDSGTGSDVCDCFLSGTEDQYDYDPRGALFDCKGCQGDHIKMKRLSYSEGDIATLTGIRIYTSAGDCRDFTAAGGGGGIDLTSLTDQTDDLGTVCESLELDMTPIPATSGYEDCYVSMMIQASDLNDTQSVDDPAIITSLTDGILNNVLFEWQERRHTLTISTYDTVDIQAIQLKAFYYFNQFDVGGYEEEFSKEIYIDPCCISSVTPEFQIDDKTLEIGAVGTIVLPTLAHDNSNADCTFSIDYSMLDDDLTEIDAAVQVIYAEIPTPR